MALTLRKLMQVFLGTTLIGTGVALNFSSKLGLGPWGVFHEGISLNTTLSFGSAIIATGVFVTFLWIPLKQKPGIATFVDIFWIGTVADLVIALDLNAESQLLKWIFVFVGIICIGSGTAIYVGADMGSGPRDGVMVGLESKGLKIGMARNIIEVTALALGWLLGGTVGLSSVVIAVSIGPVVQIVIPYFDLR
uniref:Putative membrane protein n=1 Tax=Candidatus Actinomarina minuta TaxID=1389454 RepID=S5DPF1_9ACTN|nr:putative membrane protein [Candidatus Actinomarina minuta]